MASRPLIVFDVNETLLDLQTMEPVFARIFDDKSAMRLWFANFIMYSAALTVAGCYVPFTDIGAAVMKMLADTRGIKVSDADKRADGKILDDAAAPRGAGRLTQASSICSSGDSAPTALSTTSRRGRLTLMSRTSLEPSRPDSVSLPAIHGTPSVPSRRAGRQR